MEWPAKSPDMNPIENGWGIIKRKIARQIQEHHTLNDLNEIMIHEWNWNNILQRDNNNCIMSMRSRVGDCLHKKTRLFYQQILRYAFYGIFFVTPSVFKRL